MRAQLALLTLGCCLAPLPAAAHAARAPRFELRGEWHFHAERYRFSGHGNVLSGRSLRSVRLGHCLVRRGSVEFSRYRFVATHGGIDYWRGRVALIGGAHCKRRLVRSTIKVESDLRFSESSRLPGGSRPPASSFERVRPRVSSHDPVIGTWLRNGAGVVVAREGRTYVGRAREAFDIANGCTVPAGSVVWRLRPLAPGRYSGTIGTFLPPPGCAAGAGQASTWRFGRTRSRLIRESSGGQAFPYARG